MFFVPPPLSPFAFAKYTLSCSSFHGHFRVWGMWILALVLWAWIGPWLRAGEEAHMPLHRAHVKCRATEHRVLPRKSNVKKLYSVMCHFGVEGVVSENYPEITLFWSFVSWWLQHTEEEAMPSGGQQERYLRVPARLQGRWSWDLSTVREIPPSSSCHSWN